MLIMRSGSVTTTEPSKHGGPSDSCLTEYTEWQMCFCCQYKDSSDPTDSRDERLL
jgi:hypothetical protein